MQITNKININLKKTFCIQYLIISIAYFLFQQHDIVAALGKGLFINILLFVLYGLLFFFGGLSYVALTMIYDFFMTILDFFLYVVTFGDSTPIKYSSRYNKDIERLSEMKRFSYATGSPSQGYRFFFQGIDEVIDEYEPTCSYFYIQRVRSNPKKLKYLRDLAYKVDNNLVRTGGLTLLIW